MSRITRMERVWMPIDSNHCCSSGSEQSYGTFVRKSRTSIYPSPCTKPKDPWLERTTRTIGANAWSRWLCAVLNITNHLQPVYGRYVRLALTSTGQFDAAWTDGY